MKTSLSKAIDLPPVWLFGFLLIAASSRALWSPDLGAVTGLGWLLFIGGLVLTGWSASHMHRANTTIVPHRQPDALVTDGPFKFSRNPIYLSDLAMLAGLSLMINAPLGLLLVAAFERVLTARFILPEETRLSAKFGPAFDAYCTQTRRWV